MVQERRSMKDSNNKKLTSIYVKEKYKNGTSKEYYKFFDLKKNIIVERTEIIRNLKNKKGK